MSTQERRWLRLQRELVIGFRRGTDRLCDTDWLAKNDVTLTECGKLSDWIASCLASCLAAEALK